MPQQGFHFAGKEQRIAIAPPVERLDSHGVAGERQRALDRIVYSEGEYALQTLRQPAKTPLLVTVHQDLGIAAGLETMTLRLELDTQGGAVVDLAVEDGPDRPVLVAHRLVAGMQVDDREAPMA